MKSKLNAALVRFVLTLLLSFGLTMPLLGLLGIIGSGVAALGVLLLLSLALCAASMNRWALLGALSVLAAGLLGWTLTQGGLGMLREILQGILLHFNGYGAVMPLIAPQTAVLVAIVMALCCFGLTSRHSGAVPGVMVVALVLVLLWLRGEPALIGWLTPAVLAALLLAVQFAHEDADTWHILPWLAAIACAACLLVPESGVTIEPMRRFADEMRAKIEDYLFFGNNVRTSFSLVTEGYYTQGITQMGGPAYPNEHPVMTVQTPARAYLKGVSMNQYTGRMWLNTVRGKQYLWVSRLHRAQRDHAFDGTLPKGALGESSLLAPQSVTITLLADGATSLFAPQRTRDVTVSGDLVPYFNDSGELFVNRDLRAGDSYTVTASLAVGGDAGLDTIVNACAASADSAAYEAVAAVYTLLPDHLQSQVYEKTWEAAAGAETPYQKALTIRNWLRANYRYKLDIEPQDPNMDFVYRFLMGYDKEGYCMHFASAMTVMCRILGLPARYVEGYLAEPDANGLARVTGLQAHAWTEVYFAGFGWLVFDPTPPRHTPNGTDSTDTPPESDPPPEEEPTPTPEPEQPTEPPESPAPTPSPQTSNEPDHSPPPDAPDDPSPEPEQPPQRARLWWLWLLLALAAVLTLRILYTLPQNEAKRAKDAEARWLVWSQALHDALRIRALPKLRGESPMAYLRRLAQRGLHPELLDDAGELEALVFYGRHTPDNSDVQLTRDAYLALWNDFDRLHKTKLTLLRALTTAKRRDFRRT